MSNLHVDRYFRKWDLKPKMIFVQTDILAIIKNNNKEKKSSVFGLISVSAEVQIHDIGIRLD